MVTFPAWVLPLNTQFFLMFFPGECKQRSTLIKCQRDCQEANSPHHFCTRHLNKLNQAQGRLKCLTCAELGGWNQLKHWPCLISCCRTRPRCCRRQSLISNRNQMGTFASYLGFFPPRTIHVLLQRPSDRAPLFCTTVVNNTSWSVFAP